MELLTILLHSFPFPSHLKKTEFLFYCQAYTICTMFLHHKLWFVLVLIAELNTFNGRYKSFCCSSPVMSWLTEAFPLVVSLRSVHENNIP